MMETMVTLQGWLGTDVTMRRAGDSPVANFRVGCTPRRFNRRTEEWVDAPTQWYTVNAWRGLAENAVSSLRRADPVVVHGRLNISTWVNKDGVEMTSYEVEASFIGHDLNRGTTKFWKNTRPEDAPRPVDVLAAPDPVQRSEMSVAEAAEFAA